MSWIEVNVSALIHHYGAAALFVSLTLETLGLPLPGESALILASTLAGAGKISIWAVAIAAWCGAVLGDNIAYFIGRRYGRAVVTSYGARFGVTESRYAKVEAVFARYGPLMVIAARFVVLLRQMNGLVAGTAGMHWLAFALSNVVGAALWAGAFGREFRSGGLGGIQAQIGDDDFCTVGDVALSNGFADATGGSGDDADLPFRLMGKDMFRLL